MRARRGERRVVGGEVPSVRYITEEQAAKELQARHEAEAKRKAEAASRKANRMLALSPSRSKCSRQR